MLDSIIASFDKQMRLLWKPGGFERGGNTKTHGIVRGEFMVHDGLPAELRHGIFAAAAHLPRLGALFRARALRHARHRRCRLHEHQHQADGRARAEADGRGEVHAGHVRRLHADLRDAGHQGQRAAADREREERADLLLPQPPSAARARPHHAGAVDQDAEQSVRSAVLQLRAVSARRRAGDAVLGLAEVEEADADPAAAAAARPTTICGTRWWRRSPGRRRVRLPAAAADRSAPDADREQRRALAGDGSRPGSRWRRCACRGRPSTRRRRWRSPGASRTTRGTASPSIARSATRAAPADGCTSSSRSSGTP